MSFFYEDCFPSTAQNKPDPITVLPMSLSSLIATIDQFGDFPSESPIDHPIDELANTVIDPDTTRRVTQTPRRSMRQIHKPSKYKDFHITYPSSTVSNLSTSTTLYPLSFVLSYNILSPSYQKVILFITQQVEHQSYSATFKDPYQIEAMNVEIKALEVNNTWILTDIPQHKTAIGCKWVLLVLYD